MKTYVADFETTTDENDCRIWAYALCDVDDVNIKMFGNNIDDFMQFCRQKENYKILLHEMEFYGQFVIAWLLKNGYRHTTEQSDRKTKTFNTLINNKGIYYQIEVVFERKGKTINKVVFQNSSNLIDMTTDEISENFRMPISNIKIDLEMERPTGHEITEQEKEYISNKAEIVARAIQYFYQEGLDKMTIGSCALEDYKKMLTHRRFRMYFPPPSYDEDVRESYRGGHSWLDPEFENKIIANGIVLDYNSTHSFSMYSCELPYSTPIFYKGKYKEDEFYPLYIQAIRCQFDLKEGYLPTVQVRYGSDFNASEYLTSSNNKEVTLWMTNVDLEIFLEHYKVYNPVYFGGYKFKSCVGLFDDYVEKWTDVKIRAKNEGNWALYEIAKRMLNALYGKFGTLPQVKSKIPYLDKNGVVEYKDSKPKEIDGVYLAMASFITSYSRARIIKAFQKVRDNYNAGISKARAYYTDTDSLHIELNGEDIETFLKNSGLEIDDTELGKFKVEGLFRNAKYLRTKCYYMDEYKKPHEKEYRRKITVAGMPESCYDSVTLDNFKIGTTYHGKLAPVRVPGGVVLGEVDFTLNKELYI